MGLLGGCGGTQSVVSYDAGNDRTRYDTGPMTVARGVGGSGYASGVSIEVQVTAQCQTRNCTPERANLIFLAQGNSDFSLSNRSLSITADGTTFSGGERESWNLMSDSRSAKGRIAKISMPLSDLDTIASAGSVEASLGGTSLNIGGVQDQLLKFVEAARNPAPHTENAPASQS